MGDVWVPISQMLELRVDETEPLLLECRCRPPATRMDTALLHVDALTPVCANMHAEG